MALTAPIAASSSGDNPVVAAVAGRSVRVLGYILSFSAAVNVKWRSGGTDLSGLLYAPTPATALTVPAPRRGARGWFQTAAGLPGRSPCGRRSRRAAGGCRPGPAGGPRRAGVQQLSTTLTPPVTPDLSVSMIAQLAQTVKGRNA
jgi:hypothetical protein